MKAWLPLALALLAAVPAHAGEDQAERDRIKAERSVIDTRFAQEQKACRARFAVTDCVHRAQRERNAAVADLRRQERLLNEAERERRAVERRKELDARNAPERRAQEEARRRQAVIEQGEREARAAEKAQKKAEGDAKKAAQVPREPKAAPGAHGPQGTARVPRAPTAHGPTPEEAAKNRATYEARLRAAEEHNAQLRERVAKRKKPAASDLPVPR